MASASGTEGAGLCLYIMVGAPLLALHKAAYLGYKAISTAPCFNSHEFNEVRVHGFEGKSAADVRRALMWDTASAVLELVPVVGVALRMSGDSKAFWSHVPDQVYTTDPEDTAGSILWGERALHNLALLDKIHAAAIETGKLATMNR